MSQKSHSKVSPGVLAINPSVTQKGTPPPTSRGHSSKANAPRLKLHVRRLPPGLTQTEFESCLGDHWAVGRGKIDWFLFKEGKVSTDPSKPSRPGRAYLRVTSSVTIPELSDVIRQTSFQDARNSYNDSALLGPPTLEYAPFSRVPSGKVRNDARVGTIDQDAEFIAFLESLTNPVTKPSDEEDGTEKGEKPTITPLIQYLRDKKANKAKEAAASSKPSKQSRSAAVKESKTEKSHGKKQLLSRAEKSTSEKQKKDKASKEAAVKDVVKATNKQIANGPAKAENIKSNSGPANNSPSPAPAPERRRERGNLSAATKILRRDLGLTAPTRRRERAGQSSSPGPTTEDTKKDQPSSSKAEDSNKPVSNTSKGKGNADSTPKSTPSKQLKGTPPTEPAAARNAAAAAARRTATPPSTGPSTTTKASAAPGPKNQQQQQQQQPSTTITQAFLKHANPSQGVTEDLLDKGFSQFGKVVRVEIDKKKGFGYVDFAEPASLRKAIDASPVSIAQSQVVVLERRTSAAVAQNRGGNANRNGGGGGGGHAPAHPQSQSQSPQGGSRTSQTGPAPTPGTPTSRGTPQGPRSGRGPRRGYGRGGGGGGRGK
ncbi:hypothetical protein FQN49_005603 [Arthroderma sp. PD_2]|nr:hypothetical protein FQN49_005603 [Arthroderma sp. PD_2]